FVDAINTALSKIDSLTAYDASTKASGPLAGDAGVRELRNAVLNAVYPTDGTSLAGVGIQLDRYGKLTFDQAAFTAAYSADPSGVAAKFTTGATAGFAARIQTVTKAASDPISGSITSSINGRNTQIKDLQDSIADWDDRLALRQSSLQRQFTALETALSQMNSQSSWLSGQLASLSSGK
ncbi:MAG TPA: flagellar filament capping protein FliD, partial [Marmoricola sp.]